MNSSGVYRRIDELGRIVIPVEIRKLLNIKEGENLEFYINNGEISLKKKSLIIDNKRFIEKIFKSLEDIIEGKIIITDRERILFSSDNKINNTKLTEDMLSYLTVHEDYSVINKTDMFISNDLIYIYPYYLDSDISGFIILYNIDNIQKYHKLLKFIINYVNNEFRI